MPSFNDIGLSKNALIAVDKLGFEKPTPVQSSAIPAILNGEDIIAAASTGTGKTAAFLLPTMSSLPNKKDSGRAPRMLVVTPTRELAQQISNTAMVIGRATDQFVTTLYGGTKYQKQIRELRNGCDVVIATPGRLNDLLDRGVACLSDIEVLVLDEADRMLDMGFLPDVTRIVNELPDDRQTLLFSATIDSSIRRNLGNLLNNPKTIQIAQKGQTAASVEHFIVPIKQKNKPDLLMSVLDEFHGERIIVFARTKTRVEDVTDLLERADVKVTCIHSDKTQADRRRALTEFRKGKVQVIVATDVLARGIDIPAVDYVINYDLPDMAEDYIHRIGRTGRAGETGMAISFVSQNSTKALASIERLLGHDIPIKKLSKYEPDIQLLQSRREKRQVSHSDKRAANFGKVRAARRKKHNKEEQSDYNYEGWGNLRNKKKQDSNRPNKKRKNSGDKKVRNNRSGKPLSGNRNDRSNNRRHKKNENALKGKTQKQKKRRH
ncbi:DEAD/DEAH box helicase [Adlercreutzia sp. ZJ304]|uniref:DEAD/DEAH box helicase n=1 Tax=Adlercreutzia sp. ZJ304 TaxID=2709791 RepID=UPI0013EE0582|nr:DEAD/DEAH box helicase [Adlercreutzia sp. ZJ304]